MQMTCPVSAVVPACERVAELLRCLAAIEACVPRPAEVIVYVDGGSQTVLEAVRSGFPQVRLLWGEDFVGPGGARNRLVEAASHELVANFDDDSLPVGRDYFARVMRGFERFPDMAVLTAASQACEKEMAGYTWVGIFSGCGCVFARSWFLRTRGHVPLRVAYCMEEVDVSAQLHALGGMVIHDPALWVDHLKTGKPSFSTTEADAQVLANVALFAFLRYPLVLAPLGLWNVLRQVLFMVRRGLVAGAVQGLRLVPGHLLRYRSYRAVVPLRAMASWLWLRRHPVTLALRDVAE